MVLPVEGCVGSKMCVVTKLGYISTSVKSCALVMKDCTVTLSRMFVEYPIGER